MKKLTFKKALLFISIAYAVLILIGLGVFWGYLKQYEAHHPVGAMNGYFARLKSGDTATIVEESGFVFDEYNSQKLYIQYLQEKYIGGDLRWQYADMGEKDGALVYDVYAEDQKYGTLYLTKQQNGSYAVRSDWAYGHTTTLVCPQVPLVNGIQAKPDGEAAPLTVFQGAPGTVPTVARYTVKTLLTPEITLANGQAVLTPLEKGEVQVTAVPSANDTASLKTFAEKAARTYACYISQDETYANLAALCQGGTPFLTGVRAYDGKWYNKHNSVEFANMQVQDPVMWTADTFTVEVAFDFIVKRTYDSHTYPTRYKIAVRRGGNGYQVVNIAPK